MERFIAQLTCRPEHKSWEGWMGTLWRVLDMRLRIRRGFLGREEWSGTSAQDGLEGRLDGDSGPGVS